MATDLMSKELPEDTQSIDFKRVIVILSRYKYWIILSTVLFGLLAGYIAYFKPSIYSATLKIELKKSEKGGRSEDLVAAAFGGGVKDFGQEIEVIRSKYMALKVLDHIELGTRYYIKKQYKLIELYKQSPFIVNIEFMDESIYGKKINLVPIDKESFKLEIIEKVTKIDKVVNFVINSSPKKVFSEKYNYGEKISTKWFELTVEKVQEIRSGTYYFSFVPNIFMNTFIRFGLNASMTSRKGGIMKITFQDTVPKRAQEILLALADTYKNDELEREEKKANKTLDFIDSQLKELSQVLNKSANKLKSFKQSESVVDLQSSAAEASMRLKEVKDKLRELELQNRILVNLLDYIKNNENLDSVSISSDALTNQAIYESIDKYHTLSKAKRELLVRVTEFHPDVVSLNEEARLLKENLKYIIISTLNNIKLKVKMFKGSMDEYKKDLYSIPQKAGTLATLNRSYNINEKIYTFLLEKRVETAIVNSSRESNVRVMESPEIPAFPIKPNRKYIVIIGLIVGFLFGSVIAFVLYFRDYTIKDIEEVEALVKIPFFGIIPYVSKGKYTIAYEEAFRTLRTNLEFVKVKKSSKVILVVSAISGEGKSTTLKNLAEMLVKLNRKVIVLDFDLRRPSLNQYFKKINNDLGLSMLLSGQVNISECIQKTEDGIDIIPAGPIPPNPSELIMSEASQLLFKTLGNTYDYVLIDSPPYSVVTDATILMQEADVTLFTLMLGHTKRDSIKKINGFIEKYNISSPGIVFNGIKLKKVDQHGYGYFN